jgi:hypothetical protein
MMEYRIWEVEIGTGRSIVHLVRRGLFDLHTVLVGFFLLTFRFFGFRELAVEIKRLLIIVVVICDK